MPVVVIANPKGGVGKSTQASNVAGYWASRGHAVMLGDVDRQQSARAWLDIRPAGLPPIAGWEIRDGDPARPPAGTTHVVLDTPAGLHGKLLERVLKPVRRVIVRVQPSLFDILATRNFLAELLAELAFVDARSGGQSPLDDHVAHARNDDVVQGRALDRGDLACRRLIRGVDGCIALKAHRISFLVLVLWVVEEILRGAPERRKEKDARRVRLFRLVLYSEFSVLHFY